MLIRRNWQMRLSTLSVCFAMKLEAGRIRLLHLFLLPLIQLSLGTHPPLIYLLWSTFHGFLYFYTVWKSTDFSKKQLIFSFSPPATHFVLSTRELCSSRFSDLCPLLGKAMILSFIRIDVNPLIGLLPSGQPPPTPTLLFSKLPSPSETISSHPTPYSNSQYISYQV